MSLTKLFNFKYFKENVRKSKSLLAFFLGCVPLFNILALVIAMISNKEITFLTFNNISLITFLGLYILPVVLAVSLFGFLFKRKSVDFVMSKPLSRKTIYFTNILGGIIILVIFMFINFMIYTLFGLFSDILIIPFALIIDYFVYFLISYIFMFLVSTLAITLVGNFISSIVIILLVLCLVPFLRTLPFILDLDNNGYIYCSKEECKPTHYNCNAKDCGDYYNFTYTELPNLNEVAPLSILNSNIAYNEDALIKMVVLSFIYAFIGFYTFIHRKMENNETNFKSEKVHYFVKCLTIVPFSLLVYITILEQTTVGVIISLALLFIYSIVYDLVTRKEIYKFLKSTFVTLAILGIYLGGYALYDNHKNTSYLDASKIDKISFNGVEVTDKNLIYKLIKESFLYEDDGYSIKIEAKNKVYTSYINIKSATLEEIKTVYNQKVVKAFDINKVNYAEGIPLTKEYKKLINETVKDKFDSNDNSQTLITSYSYKNHHYERLTIEKGLNQKLDNYVLNYYNKNALKLLENKELYFSYYGSNATLNDLQNKNLLNYLITENLASFKNYISKSNNEYKEQYINLYVDGYNKIIIGDTSKFIQELKEYELKVKDTDTYKEILKQYQESISAGDIYEY